MQVVVDKKRGIVSLTYALHTMHNPNVVSYILLVHQMANLALAITMAKL